MNRIIILTIVLAGFWSCNNETKKEQERRSLVTSGFFQPLIDSMKSKCNELAYLDTMQNKTELKEALANGDTKISSDYDESIKLKDFFSVIEIFGNHQIKNCSDIDTALKSCFYIIENQVDSLNKLNNKSIVFIVRLNEFCSSFNIKTGFGEVVKDDKGLWKSDFRKFYEEKQQELNEIKPEK